MEQGITTIEELRAALARDRRRAWVRLLASREADGQERIRSGQIIVGPKPDGWRPRCWLYPNWTFVADEMTARDVSAWFVANQPQELELGQVKGSVTLSENAQWFRHASRQEYAGVELPWPWKSVTLSMEEGRVNAPGGYVVGTKGPSFPSFGGAYGAFFCDRWTQTGASQPILGQIDLQVVDGRARIRRVVAHAASLDVWVDGRNVRGCRLELNSSIDQLETVVERSGKLSLSLRSGLGADPWVWLKDKTDWIDYRPLTRWGGRQSPDVEFDTSEDPIAEITALASQGESTYLEYKRDLPEDTADSKRKVLKTLVAFANGDGGTMLLGVDGDDDAGTIVGLHGKPAELVRRINDLVRDRISPTPAVEITCQQVDGRFVIRADVAAGAGTLYALVLDANRPEYYVRRNGSTYYARPEELAQVVGSAVQEPLRGIRSVL